MHKHIASIIASVMRQRLRALAVLVLIGLVGCVAESDSEPGVIDEPVASELAPADADPELALDEDLEVDLDVEAHDERGEAADAAASRVCRVRPCAPGFHCCNGFCQRITPGYRCVDRSGRDTI